MSGGPMLRSPAPLPGVDGVTAPSATPGGASPVHIYAVAYARSRGCRVDDSADLLRGSPPLPFHPAIPPPSVVLWSDGATVELTWEAGAMRYRLRGLHSRCLARIARALARTLSEPGTVEAWRRWWVTYRELDDGPRASDSGGGATAIACHGPRHGMQAAWTPEEPADAATSVGSLPAPCYEYAPDAVSPPGATLLDLLEERGMTPDDLAARAGLPRRTVYQIVQGGAPIDPGTARRLECVLGVPADFWLAREEQYRRRAGAALSASEREG